MPYISPPRRQQLSAQPWPETPGELNYIVTAACLRYLYNKPSGELKKPNYEAFNSVVGVLECAKQELYRRAIAPYEDKKKEENGEIY